MITTAIVVLFAWNVVLSYWVMMQSVYVRELEQANESTQLEMNMIRNEFRAIMNSQDR